MHKRPVVICSKHQGESYDSKGLVILAIQLFMHLQTNDIKTHTNDVLKSKAFAFCSGGGN